MEANLFEKVEQKAQTVTGSVRLSIITNNALYEFLKIMF